MSIKYKLEDFDTEMTSDWSSIEDGGEARKIEISIFNPLVPKYYKNKMDHLLNDFINENNIENPINDIDSVSGIISAFIDKDMELNKKYFLSFFIWVKEKGKIKSYVIDSQILPLDNDFAKFKECVMNELENLIFCQ